MKNLFCQLQWRHFPWMENILIAISMDIFWDFLFAKETTTEVGTTCKEILTENPTALVTEQRLGHLSHKPLLVNLFLMWCSMIGFLCLDDLISFTRLGFFTQISFCLNWGKTWCGNVSLRFLNSTLDTNLSWHSWKTKWQERVPLHNHKW